MEVVEAGSVLVDDRVPVAVEGSGGAMVEVNEEGGVGLGLTRRTARRGRIEACSINISGMVALQCAVKWEKRSGDIILRPLNNRLFSATPKQMQPTKTTTGPSPALLLSARASFARMIVPFQL
jgi:hypothetical protein